MRTYTTHLRRPVRDVDRHLVVVREGFSWGAFVFSFLWVLWNRLWLVAVGFFVVEALATALMRLLGAGPLGQFAISVGIAMIAGLLGNDLKRWTLGRRGFVADDVVAAADRDRALQRWLERRPELVAGLVP
jgi:hypothetical protein